MSNDARPDLASLARMKRRRSRFWLWALPVVAVLAAGGWWWAQQSTATRLIYDTADVVRGDLSVTVIATGTVQPTTQVEISSELSGTLQSVEVDYNDQITEGQVLARLDDTKLKAQVLNAEASLAAARARLASAEATVIETADALERATSLDQRGLRSRTEYIAAKAAHDRAVAAVDSARADVTLAEANLALQEADLSKAVIRSPINGIVLSRAAEKGQIVAAALNAPVLFTLAEDLARMDLQVSIDEADIGRVAVGQDATFTVDAYAGRQFDARIASLRYAPDESDSDVVSYTAVLTVDNAELLLRPGMTATATVTVSREEGALLIPVSAMRYAPPVVATSSGSSGRGLIGLIMPGPPDRGSRGTDSRRSSGALGVWVLRGDTPVRVGVTTGASNGNQIVAISDELAEGDKVILSQREGR